MRKCLISGKKSSILQAQADGTQTQQREANMNETVYLTYIPKFNVYGVAEDLIKGIIAQGKTPLIKLTDNDLKQLKAKPGNPEATVAFIMGCEHGYYMIKAAYAGELVRSGINIKFLIPNTSKQLEDVHGLVLPGRLGKTWSKSEVDKKRGKDAKFFDWYYEDSIKEAEQKHIPILGIASGAQIVGNVHNLYQRDPKDLENGFKLRVRKPRTVTVFPESELYELVGYSRKLKVNSPLTDNRVKNPEASDLKVYAIAEDGKPEAWGSNHKNILCVQWSPDDSDINSSEYAQNICRWIAEKAKKHHKLAQRKAAH